ncbi:uncharacterized protein RSE6_00386 [Rhynchosporium secalis]|uniref:Uncharacterized protein n=1 Tax=Rhynchosporium secalis TaxID=38038 RepID=A0A1E1LV73_RHYSE|nr:uncharacterized protein RSE6_00386 [Rhynchosporium secalis]
MATLTWSDISPEPAHDNILLNEASCRYREMLTLPEELHTPETPPSSEPSDIYKTANELFEQEMEAINMRRLREDNERENMRCRDDRKLWEEIVERERFRRKNRVPRCGIDSVLNTNEIQKVNPEIRLARREDGVEGSTASAESTEDIVKGIRHGDELERARMPANEVQAQTLGISAGRPIISWARQPSHKVRNLSTSSEKLSISSTASSNSRVDPQGDYDFSGSPVISPTSLSSVDQEAESRAELRQEQKQDTGIAKVLDGGLQKGPDSTDNVDEESVFVPGICSKIPQGNDVADLQYDEVNIGQTTKTRSVPFKSSKHLMSASFKGEPKLKPMSTTNPSKTTAAAADPHPSGFTTSSKFHIVRKRRRDSPVLSDRTPKRQRSYKGPRLSDETESSDDAYGPIEIIQHAALTSMQKWELDQKAKKRMKEEARRRKGGVLDYVVANSDY